MGWYYHRVGVGLPFIYPSSILLPMEDSHQNILRLYCANKADWLLRNNNINAANNDERSVQKSTNEFNSNKKILFIAM